jgi:hypothetical protein
LVARNPFCCIDKSLHCVFSLIRKFINLTLRLCGE